MNLFNTGYGEKTKITNSKTVTEEGKYALDAVQNNPTKPNTIAYDISKRAIVADGAAAHNAAPPLKRSIQNYFNDGSLWTRISNKTFEGLYIGDYFDLTISTAYTSNEVIRCNLAHFNYYENCGDTPLAKPHVVIVPENCFTQIHQMNSTNTTEGGYHGAAIQTVLNTYATAIANKIGNSHILSFRDLWSNSVNASAASAAGASITGSSANWAWYDAKLVLMSEMQVYGGNVWSSSGYDTGIANRQLALFQHNPTALVCKLGGTDDVTASNRMYWWLRDVASSAHFAVVTSYGHADYYSASHAGGVRPLFCIG